ncbi:hypothetical protein MKW94_004955 [Papaver nudicaule]|uniref:Uncharacterized protein n=1 Tax=Papaver nudicaule TaxID=74823 RepID=A0AA41SF12_PAPNU|nr:hypothetical protein [Papaver nudicaule]
MNSNEQNEKVDGCTQRQLLISEVQWDPQNKQWRVTGQQQYDAVQGNANNPLKRVSHRRREKVENKTVIEQRLLENGANKMDKKSAGGSDHLLILADSAELLSGSVNNYYGAKDSQCRVSNINVHQLKDGSTHAHSGEKHKKKPLDTSGGLHYVEAEKNALPSNGRIRLTHLRHYARTRNHELAKESGKCVHVDPEDSQHLDKVDGVQYQNGEVNGGSQIIDFRQTPLQNGVQQLILPYHIVAHQPVQMTNRALLWNEILKGQSMKQHLSTLEPETFDGFQLPRREPEVQTAKLAAKERRKLRKDRRKRLPEEQLVKAAQQSYALPGAQMHQMYNAGQQLNWHMWNFQNWKMCETEQQKLLHNAEAGPGKLQLGKRKTCKESTVIEFQRDKSTEHRNHDVVKACMKPVGSSAKGRTRVSHFKREARLKNEHTVKINQEMLLAVSSSN